MKEVRNWVVVAVLTLWLIGVALIITGNADQLMQH